jgi:16S rRNA C967 or C1407 C5-methylase (RsmB/RsmF family)
VTTPVEKEMSDARGGYVSMSESDKFNVSFEMYYKAQKIMDETEFPLFLETCKKPLPTTFRITGHGSKVNLIKEQLLTEHIPNLEKLIESKGDDATNVISVPKLISWYPKELAYQLETDRSIIRKEPTLAALHRWLVDASENGDVTRQEAVSMIPPMLLDINSDHIVLDVCAAPGSKTSQLLEALHEKCTPGEIPSGAIIANDLNKDRAYMLFHQVKRFDSPALMVSNHDGSFFPNIYLDKDSKEPLEFDRILADVPCTGDGTTRKNIDIWKTWSPRAGLGLHPIQVRILERSLSMLKTGGRVVYSTCSYNPVENEAVVAHILKKYSGKVKIVDVSDRLSGLKYRKGLSEWRVIDKTGKESFHPERLPEGHVNDPDFRVPLSAYCSPDNLNLNLDLCVRVLPQDQNSGGFFIVLLEKISELGTEKSRGHRKRPLDNITVEEEIITEEISVVAPPMKKGRFNNADEEPFSYLSVESPLIQNIVDFFGLDTLKLNKGSFLVRSSKDKPKNIYYVSETIGKLVQGENEKLRIINTGVKCFESYDNRNQGFECPYRQTMDALPSFLPLMSKRVFNATPADLIALLSCEDSISNESLSEALRVNLESIVTGSCVFVLEEHAGKIAIPVWSTKSITKAFVARPDRPKLLAHLEKLI